MIGQFLFALVQAVTPAAQTQTPAPLSVVANPDWQRLPTQEDIARYFPKAANEEDLAGRAVLSCTVGVDGRLAGCSAEAITPEGAGFGEAAVAMSEVFRMRPKTLNGNPVAGGTVRIPISFLIPANLRTSPVRARSADVVNQIVELDCRYKDLYLDNCFVRGGATQKATEVALKLVDKVVLPSLPNRRRQGRIVLPLVFTDASGAFTPPTLITQPRWQGRPSPVDVFRAYPEAARRIGSVGNVIVECEIKARGELRGCTVFQEDPTGAGFGDAALSLAPKFKLDGVDGYGLKVEGRRIRIPIRLSPALPRTN